MVVALIFRDNPKISPNIKSRAYVYTSENISQYSIARSGGLEILRPEYI